MSLATGAALLLILNAPAQQPPVPVDAAIAPAGSDAIPLRTDAMLPRNPAEATPPLSGDTAASLDAQDAATGSDVVVVGNRHPAVDPLRGANAISSDAAQVADKALIGPAARAYKRAVPSPIRTGIRNFLYNLREPVVAINFLLQLKPGKSAETLARLAINTTVGAAGFIDIAKRKPFRLPRRRNGFADTLGYYGIGPGPFLFIPLVGPSTVRDFLGDAVDRLFLPVVVGKPFNRRWFTLTANVLRVLDHRAEFDEEIRSRRDGNPNSYAALRDFYLQRRQAEIDGLRHRKPKPAPVPATAPVPSSADPK